MLGKGHLCHLGRNGTTVCALVLFQQRLRLASREHAEADEKLPGIPTREDWGAIVHANLVQAVDVCRERDGGLLPCPFR